MLLLALVSKRKRVHAAQSLNGLSLFQIVEALLKLQYSGGPGLVNGYCRQSSIALNVEIQPSLVFTRWDVMPAHK